MSNKLNQKVNEFISFIKKNKTTSIITGVVVFCLIIFGSVYAINQNNKTPNLNQQIVKEVKNGLLTENGYSYLYKDGELQTGLQEFEGNTYYFDQDGKMAYGLQEVDGNKFYFDNETGTMIKDTTVEIDGQNYSFDSTGIMVNDMVAVVEEETQQEETKVEENNSNDSSSNTDSSSNSTTSVDTGAANNTANNSTSTNTNSNSSTSNTQSSSNTDTSELSSESSSSNTNSSSNTPSTNNGIDSLKAASGSDNILVVSSPSVSSKSVTIAYYQKNNGVWKETFKVSGIVGKNGINKVKEGDGKTPTGIFSVTKLFGIDSNPGTQLPYHKLTGSEYWCSGTLYNQWVDESTMSHNGCDKRGDEHLISYPINYDYVAALSFNSANTPEKGSAIFVHCQKGSATAGCVAMPKSYMTTFMRGINSSTKVIIDLENNISKY